MKKLVIISVAAAIGISLFASRGALLPSPASSRWAEPDRSQFYVVCISMMGIPVTLCQCNEQELIRGGSDTPKRVTKEQWEKSVETCTKTTLPSVKKEIEDAMLGPQGDGV